jgi:hypothetical protein
MTLPHGSTTMRTDGGEKPRHEWAPHGSHSRTHFRVSPPMRACEATNMETTATVRTVRR